MPFVYGGCGGNDNRFATRDACNAACPGLGANYDNCLIDSDCSIVSAGCCGACGQVSDDQLLAVATRYLRPFGDQRCSPAPPCIPCPPPGELEGTFKFYRAVCVNQQCSVQDVRKTELTACKTANDCALRDGAECCAQCDGQGWISARKGADFCGGAEVSCDACISTPPKSLIATCDDGVCGLNVLLL